MPFYVGYASSVPRVSVWEVREDRIFKIHETPEVGKAIPDGLNGEQFLRELFPKLTIEKYNLAGKFFPRMTRPTIGFEGGHWNYPGYEASQLDIASSMIQLEALYSHLLDICRVVHPQQENVGAFGHEIRNLLILASTEFEAQCKGVLNANEARPNSNRRDFNIIDYQAVAEVMRLEEYGAALTAFPWWGEIRPFDAWKTDRCLKWYQDYNAVKHDREREFKRATLGAVISAVAACAIILDAQYGDSRNRFVPAMAQAFSLRRPDWPAAERYAPTVVLDGKGSYLLQPMGVTRYEF
ncbi:hypothetical protein [Phyllobacterium sp. UNC302MFCol5.2]|uniref:hypothetical protein n=1 Tax=Phyllobacterium sp. UNC302MFCol5.2 TaxID=1449065 RepID=UPI0012DBD55F|nr:hypothetical protein [Phyllobacterium sp. UNC302MFCol5.2]